MWDIPNNFNLCDKLGSLTPSEASEEMDHFQYYWDFLNKSDTFRILVCSVLGLILTTVSTRSLSAYRSRRLFPAVDSGLTNSIYDAEPLYREGYRKFKDTPYRVTTADGDHLMIPNKLFDDFFRVLDKDPDAADLAQRVTLEVKHTGLDTLPLLKHTLQHDLPKNLTRIHPILVGAVEGALKTELLPKDGEWTKLLIDGAIGRMVAIVSGTVFMGGELARRDEWLDAASNYTGTAFYALFLIKMWPKPLRNIASLFNFKLRSLRKQRRNALNFLVPIIQRRRALMASGEKVPDDMVKWMLDKGENIPDSLVDEKVAGQLLQLTLVAIHTTSLTTTFLFYDLLLHGGTVIDDIRAEIRAVLKEHNGFMSPQALAQMKLLDSAIKESQRMHPLGLTKYARYVQNSFKISTGQTIPAGSVVEVPFVATLRDPELYSEPEKYDPYRFYEIRSGKRGDPMEYKVKDQHQFVVATRDNLSWGIGRHACPGRFFAANEIKLIAAQILMNHELKLPEGMTAEKAIDYFVPKELFIRSRIGEEK